MARERSENSLSRLTESLRMFLDLVPFISWLRIEYSHQVQRTTGSCISIASFLCLHPVFFPSLSLVELHVCKMCCCAGGYLHLVFLNPDSTHEDASANQNGIS
jgi:hypothetical protein